PAEQAVGEHAQVPEERRGVVEAEVPELHVHSLVVETEPKVGAVEDDVRRRDEQDSGEDQRGVDESSPRRALGTGGSVVRGTTTHREDMSEPDRQGGGDTVVLLRGREAAG